MKLRSELSVINSVLTYLARERIAVVHAYICEPIFETGGRADILVLDLFKVIEIAVSETEASLKAKAEYYPPGLFIEVIRCQ